MFRAHLATKVTTAIAFSLCALGAQAADSPYVGTWEAEKGSSELTVVALSGKTYLVTNSFLNRMTGREETQELAASLNDAGALVIDDGMCGTQVVYDHTSDRLVGNGSAYVRLSD